MQIEMSPGTSAAVLPITFIYLAQISKGKIEQEARWALSLRCWQFSFLNCFTNECGCLGKNFHFYSVHENGLSGYSCLTKEATAWSWPQLIQKKGWGLSRLGRGALGKGCCFPSLSCLCALSQIPWLSWQPFYYSYYYYNYYYYYSQDSTKSWYNRREAIWALLYPAEH